MSTQPPPQRPGLQHRALSAPAGGLIKSVLSGTGTAAEDTGHQNRTSTMEKDGTENAAETSSTSDFPYASIAVVGGEKVGKSTFIKRALKTSAPPSSQSTTKKMALDESIYSVRLLEIHSKDITFGSKGEIVWPALDDQAPPEVDGVLVLHDSTQPETPSETSRLLDALAVSTLPYLPVACKCDVDNDSNHQTDPVFVRSSPDPSQSPRAFLAFILRSIIGSRHDLAATPNKQDSGESSQNRSQANPTAPRSLHARANSETPAASIKSTEAGAAIFERRVDGTSNEQPNSSNLAAFYAQNPKYGRSNTFAHRPRTPPPQNELDSRRQSPSGDASPNGERIQQRRRNTTWRHSGGSDAFSNFLELEDEANEPRSLPTSSSENKERPTGSLSSEGGENGYTFDELVDRLVAQPMSKQDSKFASVFLCLYRKFAAPTTLLSALISRFETSTKSVGDQLTLVTGQLRLLTVLAQWAADYPGDFVHPRTRRRIMDFVVALERSPYFMFAAKEIGSYLEISVEDDETGWPYRDADVENELTSNETPLNDPTCNAPPNSQQGMSTQSREENGRTDDKEEEQDPIYNLKSVDLSQESPEAVARLSGAPSGSSAGRSSTTLNQSLTSLSLEAAQKGAEHLDLRPKFPLTKTQWRQFMEIQDEDFARELTRIDWIMYNSFRTRDLVRHVSLTGPEREKVKNLQNVSRMIKQFNHLAFFVSSMILLRDKPKHRAKALEKFMNIALRLRRQNNYNSLGAVIAGINGTPVYRLMQTRELVPQHLHKEFMRLVILMSTQKSHFAYRLAWENSPSDRIPFLPLHRRDLVGAEEGNKTFIGEDKSRINWRKFEVMGEILLGIQRSQKTPYTHMYRSEDAMQLILETHVSGDDEDLFTRSLQVEPAAGNETGRRKLGNWISRNVLSN